jgi:membrane protease YdiL (CAAX protease family)
LLGFLNRYSAAKAAMLSALLFAVMHINPVLMVMTFATGCFYAWMVKERAR